MNFTNYKSNSIYVVPFFIKDLYLSTTSIQKGVVEKIGFHWIMTIIYNPSTKEERLKINKKLDLQDNVISVDYSGLLIIAKFSTEKSKYLRINNIIKCGKDALFVEDIVDLVLYWKYASYEVFKCLKKETQAINDSLGFIF